MNSAAGPDSAPILDSAVLGVDFGTSNTVAALSVGCRCSVVEFDGQSFIPSAVYLQDDGNLAVGRDAERLARLAPERFEPNPKRRIDEEELLLGVQVVSVQTAIAAVLRRVWAAARTELDGGRPAQVNLTHPAEWGTRRRRRLAEAARDAGMGEVMLIPEPIAAATQFGSLAGQSLPAGSSLAVYDLGGGTFDCAVLDATATGYLVLSEGGLADVGGIDFDQAILEHLGRTIADIDPYHWEAMAVPQTAADRRAARSLRVDVRAAKESLSRFPQTDVPLAQPFPDALLTRGEVENLIRPAVVRTVTQLQRTIRQSERTPTQLAGIFLVGGSSRIPLVAALIADRTGIVPVTQEHPEIAVAMGAALARTVTTNKNSAPRPSPPAPPPPASPQFRPQEPSPPARAAISRSTSARPADGWAADPMLPAQLSVQQLPTGTGRQSPTRVPPAVLAGVVLVTVALIAGLIWLTGRRLDLVEHPVVSVPAGSVPSSAGPMPKKCAGRPAGTATPGACLTRAITPALKTFVTFDTTSGGTGNFRATIDAASPNDVVTLTGRDDRSGQTLLLIFVQLADGAGRDQLLQTVEGDLGGGPAQQLAKGGWTGRIVQGQSMMNLRLPTLAYALDSMPVVILMTPSTVANDSGGQGMTAQRLREEFTTQVLP